MTIITLMLYIGIAALILTLIMVYVSKIHKSVLMTFAQNFAGILFVFSGWVKAVDPMGTAIKMQDYFAEFEVTFSDTALNFIAPLFPLLSGYSLAFAIFMIILEIVLGIMLIMGDRPKLTSWLFFLIVVFFTCLTGFTFLTGYVPTDQNFFTFSAWSEFKATNMRVTDCGCFGDFIKLDPRVSFYKDVFLMVPAIYFLFKYKLMHQVLTQSKRNLINLFAILFLLVYCIYNFYWNEPHIDFRPFKNGTNVTLVKDNELKAANAVQIVTMRMKNKNTGEIRDFAYADYLKNLAEITEEYETIEQIKTEPTIEPTKISDFLVTDYNDDDVSDVYLNNPEPHLMVLIYDAGYKAIPEKKIVIDSIFVLDTTYMDDGNISVDKNLKSTDSREVTTYNIIWEDEFINKMKNVVLPLQKNALSDGVKMSVVISGIDKDKADSLKEITGLDANFYTADEKLIKTIMRSNPGIILWKNGVLLHKWHYKKLPNWNNIKAKYLK